MVSHRRITDLPKEIFIKAMPQVVPDKPVIAVMGVLSNTGKHFHRMFQEELTKRAMRTLSQAVIDDDRETVKRILNSKPELLTHEPPSHLKIESKLTWQKFYAEKPAIMAAKRKQIKMIELLLPYYDKLEQMEAVKCAKAEALSAWSYYEMQKNAQGEDEIVISREYTLYAQSLIDVFREENFPDGTLSKKAEEAFSSLFHILLPKIAVKLDDAIDPELFLLALYKAYCYNFKLFQNWKQRDAFCVRMIGLAQSVLSPESAKIFCEGLYDVVEENKKISGCAESLKLIDGESFYRSSREARTGLGFEYLCRGGGGPGIFGMSGGWAGVLFARGCLEKLYQTKTTSFRNMTRRLQREPDQFLSDRRQSGCVIL